MIEALGVSNSFLTYHLENLGELVGKTEDGRYRLSSFGEAAIATMSKVEDIPTTPLHRSSRIKTNGLMGRTAIALGIICILLIAGLGGTILYYAVAINNKQSALDLANKTINQLNATITVLQNIISASSLVQTQYETVYINSDGSVSPYNAPISSVDNVTYTFIGDISYPAYSGVVVERNNIVIDGAGYTLNGSGQYTGEAGFSLTGIDHVTIKNTTITNFTFGIEFDSSSNNTVSGNNVIANHNGVGLVTSSNNTISGNSITSNPDDDIGLVTSSSNTVSGNNITNSGDGIDLDSSSNNCVSGNSITNNANGILLASSSSNTVSGNNITNNEDGVGLVTSLDSTSPQTSSGNIIYHNNFVNNTAQASTYMDLPNVWDNGYPSGGNYWSDYNGTDLYSGPYQNVTGSDGIGDKPYVIYANNTDDYPLMGMFSDFSVATGVDVEAVSNSTVSDFQFNGTAVLFNVSGVSGTTGFCNVRVPTNLLNGTLTVLVNETKVQYSLLPSSNSSISYLYFTYGQSTEQVAIMPEYPDPLNILAMFMLATLLVIATHKKKHSNS